MYDARTVFSRASTVEEADDPASAVAAYEYDEPVDIYLIYDPRAVDPLLDSDFITGETIRVDGGRHVR